uniref:Uncharacterized protein n=1 Tax=Panagrolaimus sp. PS1159 TaxID=55785 RepID=A0AC35F2S9_9BILA
KNAKVHVPKTPQSTNLTTNVPPKHSPEDSTEASFPWWGFLIIGIVLLIVVGVICFIIYRLYKKHQTSKRVSQKADETKPLKRVSQKADETKPLKRVPQKADETKPSATVSKADIAADVKTPTKKHDDLKAVKVEKTQMPKKDKKKTTKTEEPKTTDDLPASNVSKQELSAPP